MDLPQEIVDKVIDNLAFDPETLKSTSLVCKSWTHQSRRWLFYYVPIDSLGKLEMWSQSISPNPDGIASYPRHILLSLGVWVEPETLDQFHDHIRSFSRVERLVISGLKSFGFDATSTLRYFGNFAATVRHLELVYSAGTPASMVSFICAFPLLDDLTIEFYARATPDGPENQGEVTYPTPSFKGKFKLLDIPCEQNPVVESLCALPLSFHTISVSSHNTGRLSELVSLVNKCGETLRSLRITRKIHGALLWPTGASLDSCRALEELRVRTIHPMHLVTTLGELLPTLSNTTNLSRIVLSADGRFSGVIVLDKAASSVLDAVLTKHAEKVLAERQGRRLTLQFRTGSEGAIGEREGWARELAGLLVHFSQVGKVEFEPKR